MSYQIRCMGPSGSTFLVGDVFATRGQAEEIRDSWEKWGGGCFKYTVEEVPDAPEPKPELTSTTERLVSLFRDYHGGQQTIPNDADGVEYVPGVKPEPGSTAAHHVEILRKRIVEMEAVQKAISQDLAFALQLGDALRQAMRTGEWRAGNDAGMAGNAIAGWDRFRPGLGKATSVPAGASEAPGEGGDSDRRRLEVLERFLDGDTFHQIWKTTQGNIVAGTTIEGQEYAAPTLAALADKLAEKEGKP